jgi:arylsulfatase A-like enzyme
VRFFRYWIVLAALNLAGADAVAKGKATHVVLIVWDGMRPDFVSEQNTPTLARLLHEGVLLRNHHSVYVTSTEVNAATLATGGYPEQDWIIGNEEFRPKINPTKKSMTGDLGVVRRGDASSGNHYLGLPTVAELLQKQGRRTAVAGTKSVALLQDRAPRPETSLGIDLFEGQVLPESWASRLTAKLGPFPAAELPKTKCDRWTTEALITLFWENEVPAFSVLWLGEPDYSQHHTGPGSATSLAAIRGSDAQLARVLEVLDQKQIRAQTDVILVSDHGFSTIGNKIDVPAVLRRHGFRATREFPSGSAKAGEILVVENGGSVFFYVTGHDRSLLEDLVQHLQMQPFCGVLFTRDGLEGTFRLEEGRIGSPEAPDVVLSFRWKADRNANGAPGSLYSDESKYGAGQGMHASLSPFDLHNTGVIVGPDFRKDWVDDLPTGNIDVAPTVYWILGIKPEQEPAGRVLQEAMAGATASQTAPTSHHLEATRHGPQLLWRQYLDYSEFEGVRYLERGNGEQVSATAPPTR